MPTKDAKLRIGLLLSSVEVTAWVVRMVDRIQRSHYAEIVLLVIDSTPQPGPAPRWPVRLLREPRATWQQLMLRGTAALHQRVEARPELPDAFAPVDLSPLVPSAKRLEVRPERTQWSDRLSAADVQAIRDHEIDVLVRIGFRILRGDVLQAARHGVWSFHHGDNRVNRGGPPAFWEVMQGWPQTGCTLQVLSEDLDNGRVLARTASSTIATSVTDNKRSTYWKSLSLLPRQLEALHRLGSERFFADARAREPDPQLYSQRLFRAPEHGEYARSVMRKLFARVALGVAARLWFGQWILLVHFSSSLSGSLWRYRRLVPPRDRFWADPFVIEREGRYWVFFEELMYASRKGHISVMEVLPDGSHGPVQQALVEAHHLSYPFLLEHDGELFMIPEARTSRAVSLYRCVEFPARWEKVMDLMSDVGAVDATVHRHDGRWWLFANMVENPGASSCDELFLFHSDRFPSQQWTPHPMNPVISDVGTARPAGRLFMHDGRLYRPSQDCGPLYGYGLNFNRIDRMDTEGYAETTVTRAGPHWAPDLLGVHTFNAAGRLHVIDALIRRRRSGPGYFVFASATRGSPCSACLVRHRCASRLRMNSHQPQHGEPVQHEERGADGDEGGCAAAAPKRRRVASQYPSNCSASAPA